MSKDKEFIKRMHDIIKIKEIHKEFGLDDIDEIRYTNLVKIILNGKKYIIGPRDLGKENKNE